MKDKRSLLDFLSSAGLERSGDLIQLVPAECSTKEIERTARTMVATISTRARDRAGDIIEPKGVRLERYLKNPVVLWAHDYAQRPVAKSLWVKVRNQSVVAKPRFHDSTDLAREVFLLYAQGYLNAWSIGFIPEDWDEEGKGFRITKWDLLEYSAVPIPSNPEALTLALKEKRITTPLLCKALGAALPDIVPYEITSVEREGASRPREAKVRAAIPYEHTPLDETDAEWDASKEVARASVEDLRKMCAWVADDAPGVKSSYKLPHHRASSPHRLVWNAVHAAGAALQGARGGVEIPEKDLPGVKGHIARHYRDFGRAAPWEELEIEMPEKAIPPPGEAAGEERAGPEPGISAELARRISAAVREEVRGEIRRLRGSLEPYEKEEGK